MHNTWVVPILWISLACSSLGALIMLYANKWKLNVFTTAFIALTLPSASSLILMYANPTPSLAFVFMLFAGGVSFVVLGRGLAMLNRKIAAEKSARARGANSTS